MKLKTHSALRRGVFVAIVGLVVAGIGVYSIKNRENIYADVYEGDGWNACLVDAYNSRNGFEGPYIATGSGLTSAQIAELATISYLNCTNTSIWDGNGTTGYKSVVVGSQPDFSVLPGLENLSISYSGSSLDLSGLNSNLTELSIYNADNLTSLTGLAALTKLEGFSINAKNLTELNGVSGLTELINLNIHAEKLESQIDVSALTKLRFLEIDVNDLESINLANATSLEYLFLDVERLADLDVSRVSELRVLNLSAPRLETLNLVNNNKLETLWLRDMNSLRTLELGDLPLLTSFLVRGASDLGSFNMPDMPKLRDFTLWGKSKDEPNTRIESIDLSGSPELENFDVLYVSSLETVDLDQNSKLWMVRIVDAAVSEVDLSGSPDIYQIYITDTNLESFDFSNNTKVGSIIMDNNKLTEMDVTQLADLDEISVSNNYLETLDLSQNTDLKYVDVSKNNIRYVDLTNMADDAYGIHTDNILLDLVGEATPSGDNGMVVDLSGLDYMNGKSLRSGEGYSYDVATKKLTVTDRNAITNGAIQIVQEGQENDSSYYKYGFFVVPQLEYNLAVAEPAGREATGDNNGNGNGTNGNGTNGNGTNGNGVNGNGTNGGGNGTNGGGNGMNGGGNGMNGDGTDGNGDGTNGEAGDSDEKSLAVPNTGRSTSNGMAVVSLPFSGIVILAMIGLAVILRK